MKECIIEICPQNLYRVLIGHLSPKDSQAGIYCYMIAKDDKEVFDRLKKEMYWDDLDEYDEDEASYDMDGDIINTEYIIKNKGDWNSEVTDLYYGASICKWELVKKNISAEEIKILQNCGIFEDEEVINNRKLGVSYY